MKIGILTFHRAINYGAVLQCYALYCTLKNMGHDVEVIDYRPEAIEKYRMYFRKKDFCAERGLIAKFRYLLSSLSLIGSKHRTSAKFDEFLSNKINVSSLVRNHHDVPLYYDAIFFGSDQIWNPEICEGLDKVYYGQFEKSKSKFFGYAASLGRMDLIQGQLSDSFRNYLSVYDRIGVRENALQDFLMRNYSIESEMVCDPSLLLSRKDCEGIAIKPKDDNYVVVFNLEGNSNVVSFAQNVANQIGSKVIQLRAVTNHLRRYPCEIRTELSPAEFLGYIKHAKCIVTDSFHATSFSIIMHKDFYTILRSNNNDRAKTILSVAGLSERLVDAKCKVEFSSINYHGIDNRLTTYRDKSMSFIAECCCK